MSKTLYELKQEKNGNTKNKNTVTDADYRLRDKLDPKDKKNTVWMTPNPTDVKRRLEKARQDKADLEELEKLEAGVAPTEEEVDKAVETLTKPKTTTARKTTPKAK